MPNNGHIKQENAEDRCKCVSAGDGIAAAATLLRSGKLVAIPTETVYGLAADATDPMAVARIFEAKGRPHFNPLIIHVPNVSEARKLGKFPPKALELARAFWPGPLTLVVKRVSGCPVSELASAGLSTLAIRVPAHPVAQAVLLATGLPLAAPSANRSGQVSATTAAHVAHDLGASVALILDAGPTRHGIESTVIDATSETPRLLRPGAIPAAKIEEVLGERLLRTLEGGMTPSSPGQLESHYAPRAALRLNAQDVAAGEALLAFGDNIPPTAGLVRNLSSRGDLVEAAARLFSDLRALDATGVEKIAVMPIPDEGLGEAINDRLRRAAAPRHARQ